MKTHQLAGALEVLAKLLKKTPNVELKDLHIGKDKKPAVVDPNDAALSLSWLVALSKFDKAQWKTLIEEWGFPIEIPTTYSARDTVGALFRYFGDNPAAMTKFTKERASKSSKASSELMKTLSLLLDTPSTNETSTGRNGS